MFDVSLMPSGVVYFICCINLANLLFSVFIFCSHVFLRKASPSHLRTPPVTLSRELNIITSGCVFRAPQRRSHFTPLYMFGLTSVHNHIYDVIPEVSSTLFIVNATQEFRREFLNIPCVYLSPSSSSITNTPYRVSKCVTII